MILLLLLLTCSCRTKNLLQTCAEKEKSDYGEERTTSLSTKAIYIYNLFPSQPFQGLNDLIRVQDNSNTFLSGRIYSIYLPMSGSSENFHKIYIKKKKKQRALQVELSPVFHCYRKISMYWRICII